MCKALEKYYNIYNIGFFYGQRDRTNVIKVLVTWHLILSWLNEDEHNGYWNKVGT